MYRLHSDIQVDQDITRVTMKTSAQDISSNTFENGTSKTSPPPLLFSKRFFVSVVIFMSFVNLQIIRNNINITVVEMTTNKSYIEGNETITKVPEFNWDTSMIGLIMSITWYGGLFSVFGGFMADKFGGATSCTICLMIAGITTVLHPATLAVNFYAFVVLRFITGLCEIFFYTNLVEVNSRWIPKRERSRLIAFSFTGTNVGATVVYPICAYLAQEWRWQIVFYVSGIISIMVSLLFWATIKNHPSEDRCISIRELQYILEETDASKRQKVTHPYKSIFTSGPVWSLCAIIFVYMWVSVIRGISVPLYVKDITQKEISKVGLISSIPSALNLFMYPISGVFLDYCKNHSTVTLTRIHKITVSVALLSSCFLFLGSAMAFEFTITLISFTLIHFITSPIVIIVESIMISLAPNHCSIVAGLVTVFFALGAIVTQTVTGFMIKNHTSYEWANCFCLAALVTAVGTVVFTIFGSSETQPWSDTRRRVNVLDDSKYKSSISNEIDMNL